LPFAVFTVMFARSDLVGCVPRVCSVAKHEQFEDAFTHIFSEVRAVKSDDLVSRYECVVSSQGVGVAWDFKCLGISIGFSGEQGPVRRPPLCSLMRKDGNSSGSKKHGRNKPLGLPVSSLWAGSTLFLTAGEYLGLGFSGDLGYAFDFIKLIETRNPDVCDLLMAFRKSPPSSGSVSNAVAIAYLCSLKESSTVDECVSIIPGPWGNLLEWAFIDAGITVSVLKGERIVAESSIDRAYDHPHFVLVDVVSTAGGGPLSKEVINTIDLTAVGGDVIEVNNDLAGYMRGRMNDAAVCTHDDVDSVVFHAANQE